MSSLYTAWLRTYFPQWVMIIPSVLGSARGLGTQPTTVAQVVLQCTYFPMGNRSSPSLRWGGQCKRFTCSNVLCHAQLSLHHPKFLNLLLVQRVISNWTFIGPWKVLLLRKLFHVGHKVGLHVFQPFLQLLLVHASS